MLVPFTLGHLAFLVDSLSLSLPAHTVTAPLTSTPSTSRPASPWSLVSFQRISLLPPSPPPIQSRHPRRLPPRSTDALRPRSRLPPSTAHSPPSPPSPPPSLQPPGRARLCRRPSASSARLTDHVPLARAAHGVPAAMATALHLAVQADAVGSQRWGTPLPTRRGCRGESISSLTAAAASSLLFASGVLPPLWRLSEPWSAGAAG